MENTIIVLDTCMLFDFLAGKNEARTSQVEHFILGGTAAVSVVTVFELLRGVESTAHIAQRRELINLCTILDLTPPISERAASIYTSLKKNGSLIHMEDILIAATALHWRYPVLTSNTKDFSRISGLKIA